MSAFLVSHTHIAAIVKFSFQQYAYKSYLGVEDYDACERNCEMLAAECVKSVSYRYPKDTPEELPGPINGSIAVCPSFTDYRWSIVPELTPVEALKAVACLEYQSCEHPQWNNSEACKWLDKLRHHAISLLPGYEQAAWEVDEPINA